MQVAARRGTRAKMIFKLMDGAKEDIAYWKKNDRARLEKIRKLTLNIGQTPFTGLGKPEPLRHELAGWWSRRISGEHRLVYRVIGHRGDELCQIAQARGHY